MLECVPNDQMIECLPNVQAAGGSSSLISMESTYALSSTVTHISTTIYSLARINFFLLAESGARI